MKVFFKLRGFFRSLLSVGVLSVLMFLGFFVLNGSAELTNTRSTTSFAINFQLPVGNPYITTVTLQETAFADAGFVPSRSTETIRAYSSDSTATLINGGAKLNFFDYSSAGDYSKYKVAIYYLEIDYIADSTEYGLFLYTNNTTDSFTTFVNPTYSTMNATFTDLGNNSGTLSTGAWLYSPAGLYNASKLSDDPYPLFFRVTTYTLTFDNSDSSENDDVLNANDFMTQNITIDTDNFVNGSYVSTLNCQFLHMIDSNNNSVGVYHAMQDIAYVAGNNNSRDINPYLCIPEFGKNFNGSSDIDTIAIAGPYGAHVLPGADGQNLVSAEPWDSGYTTVTASADGSSKIYVYFYTKLETTGGGSVRRNSTPFGETNLRAHITLNIAKLN